MARRTIAPIFLRLLAVIALQFAAVLTMVRGPHRWRQRFSAATLARIVLGAAFLFAAQAVLYVSFPGLSANEQITFAIVTFTTAVAVELLIGGDIRRRLRQR